MSKADCVRRRPPTRRVMFLILSLLAFGVTHTHADDAASGMAPSAGPSLTAIGSNNNNNNNGANSLTNNIGNVPLSNGGLSGMVAAAAGIVAVEGVSFITTTTPANVEQDVPEYLRYCFNAEPELCLNLQGPSAMQPQLNGQQAQLSAQIQQQQQQQQQHSELNDDPSNIVGDTQNLGTVTATATATIGGVLPSSSSPITPSNWPVNRDVNKCQCRPHPTLANSWYCCNITNMSMISTCNNSSNWTHLHIRNMTMPELDLSNAVYQKLQSLAITDGDLRNVTKSLSRVSAIKCLNISNNNLWNISMRAMSSVPNLRYLDISKNNLSRIPKWNQNQNISVDVRDNKRMLCDSLLEAIFRDSFKFVEPDNSYCLLNYTYNWFNSTEYVSIRQVELTRRFQTECPVIPGYGNCSCSPEQMITLGDGDSSKPAARPFCRVDCSNLGLTELPPNLPENTFSLNISNNNITSFGKHFHSNPTYENIAKLYADNNKITSMYELEGTKFMYRFQRLYLRGNALSKIPEYLLTNALNSDVGRMIYLGGNKLQCDCNSAKVLKLWLLERSRDIPDYNEIECRNMPKRVMELQEIKMCQSPHDWTDYIYYLIATEVLLLLALITKVSYDYWVFKTAGYLPWPASKMPKLPCDWLCES